MTSLLYPEELEFLDDPDDLPSKATPPSISFSDDFAERLFWGEGMVLVEDEDEAPIAPVEPKPAKTYRRSRRVVTRAFREFCLHEYPALKEKTLLGILEIILFTSRRDSEDDTRIIVPRDLVAKHCGLSTYCMRDDRCVTTLMERFREKIFDPLFRASRYQANEAATVSEYLPPALEKAREANFAAKREGTGGECVDFLTGKVIKVRKRREELKQELGDLREDALTKTPTDHPARELMILLNQQPSNTFTKLLEKNWPAVKQAYRAMPEETEEQRDSKKYTELVIDDLELFPATIYGGSEYSPRLFAQGRSVHQLPRALRKIAFAGTVTLDLVAAQLAIAAKLWNLPVLSASLVSDISIWKRFIQDLDLSMDYKDILKKGVYSLLYGMGREKLTTLVETGDDGTMLGLGDKTSAWISHPIIQELLRARVKRLTELYKTWHVVDAFGRKLNYEKDKGQKRRKHLLNLMAQEIQSYELRIMLKILPILETERGVTVVSWLHDGITLDFRHAEEKDRQARRIRNAMNAEAEALGIITRIEVDN